MSLLSYYWNERFSSCTLGWILCNLGDLLLFILLVSTFLLSDSLVWYRSSVLFLTVWDFCHGEPSPPKLFRDGDGRTGLSVLCFFFFFLVLLCCYHPWTALLYLDVKLILQILSDSSHEREHAFYPFSHLLFISLIQGSLSSLSKDFLSQK